MIDTTVIQNKVAGLLGAKAISAWMSTLDYRVFYHDPTIDPVRDDCHGQYIYVFWHEHILFPLYLRGHCDLAMLLSRHRDADVLERVAHHLGFECVRGSTYRGAASAIRELSRRSRHKHLTITPDGPRGPRRRLAQGAVYLASRLGRPLVVMGFGYDRCWRLPSWDRFAIPKPFARARAVVSPPIHVPPGLGRDELDEHRLRVERILTQLTDQAEDWARSRLRADGEQIARKQTAPLASRRTEENLRVFPADSDAPSVRRSA